MHTLEAKEVMEKSNLTVLQQVSDLRATVADQGTEISTLKRQLATSRAELVVAKASGAKAIPVVKEPRAMSKARYLLQDRLELLGRLS